MEKIRHSKPVNKGSYISFQLSVVTWASLLSFIKPSTLPCKQVLWLIGSYILEGLTLQWCHSKWELVFSFHMWIVFIWYLIVTLSDYMPTIIGELCSAFWKLCHTFKSVYNEYIFSFTSMSYPKQYCYLYNVKTELVACKYPHMSGTS